MKKVFLVCLSAFLLVGLFDLSQSLGQTKKPVVIRLVCPAPEGDWPLNFKDQELAKRFNERAKGEYVIQVYSGGALAKLPEYFDAVRTGVIEMADAPWGMYSFLDQRMGLLELPFLFDNSEATVSAIKELEAMYDKLMQEKFNAKGIGLMYTGGLQLFSRRPVRTMEDWKGLLVGVFSPSVAALVKGLGASPVTVMWVDMYEALQKKVIEASGQGTHGGVVTGLPDICKHVTFFLGIAAWNGYLLNLDVWKKMPKHIQNIFVEEVGKAASWMTEVTTTKLFDEDMKVFREKGVSVYLVPKTERDRWADALKSYREQEFSKAGEFGAKVKKLAEEANRKYPRYTERSLY